MRSKRIVRATGAIASITMVALSGCGSEPATMSGSQLKSWKVPAPYLPPPDPSAYPRSSVTAELAQAPSASQSSGRDEQSGAPTDEQITAELKKAYGDDGGADLDRAAIGPNGLAVVPENAPPKLIALMHAANDVARKPYVYGGGHGSNPDEIWADSAYDCSGSVSYALAAAGYLNGPEASGPLMKFGKPGPGKWVSIFTNEGHAFMVVAGLRFDTSGRQITGTRWQAAGARSYAGFVVRHPPGL